MKITLPKLDLKHAKYRPRLGLGARLTLSIGGIICLIILATFGWLYQIQKRNVLHQVEIQTQALLSEILITSQWMSQHGAETPLLADQNLEAQERLARASPAMVVEEMASLFEHKDNFSFHVTSLRLKNPDNAPDAFEEAALHRFEQDPSPVSGVETYNGQRSFRYMVPLRIEPSCLTCHGDQGYQVGDIRGGLDVTVPLVAADQALATNRRILIISAMLTIVLAMGALYWLLRRLVVAPLGELEQAALRISQNDVAIRCNIHTGDELELLGNAFNQMVANLKISQTALHAQITQRARELTSLSEVALILSQAEALQDVLDDALAQVIQTTEMDAGAIHFRRNDGKLELAANHGVPVAVQTCINALGTDAGFITRVIEGKTPILFSNPTDHLCPASCIEQDRCAVTLGGYQILISLPLCSKNHTFGTLTLFNRAYKGIDSDLVQFLTCVANQLGLAIENARYQDEAEQVAILEERTRLGRELHDNQAQMWGYLNLRTRAIIDMLQAGQTHQATVELQKVRGSIKEAYEEVRRSIFDLRYSAPADGDLSTALQHYLEEYTLQCGVKTELTPVDPPSWQFTGAVEIQLLRIIQEALTNVRRHAQATRVRVSLKRCENATVVRIEDNGQGLHRSQDIATGRPRFGLQIMRERAESVGGRLNISESEWGGALIEFILPASNADISSSDNTAS